MSKSDPNSAIFMEDTAEDVKKKISKAYCPPTIISFRLYKTYNIRLEK